MTTQPTTTLTPHIDTIILCVSGRAGGGRQDLEGLLRGMPSANQLARGREGLNEANDPAAITAERRTLNIGIPVWNEWTGVGGGQRQAGPEASSCQTSGSAAAVRV